MAAAVAQRKDCRLSIENMAAVAGVCRSTVKNAIFEAGQRGLPTVEECQITSFRDDTNVVRIGGPGMAGLDPVGPDEGFCLANPCAREGASRSQLSGEGGKRVTGTPIVMFRFWENEAGGAKRRLPRGSGRLLPKQLCENSHRR